MKSWLRRLGLAAALWAGLGPASADQNTVTPIPSAPLTMATLATFLNNAFLTIGSCYSGGTAPAVFSGVPKTFQCWVDTSGSPVLYKIYDGTSWISIGQIDTAAHSWTPTFATIRNTGLVTLPTATDTLVGRATTDTLTNKTLTAAVENTPAITAGTIDALTRLGIRSTGAAFDLRFATAEAISAARTLSWVMGNADRTITLAGNVSLGGALSTAGALTFSGAFAGTFTLTNTTTVTFPLTGTLATLAGSETFTNKTLTAPALGGLVNASGAWRWSTQSAPAQITSNQNNYNPSSVNCASSTTLLINSDAARDITGLAGGVTGCDMRLVNNGSFSITLKDNSGSSSAGNKFCFGADMVMAANAGAALLYDGTATCWRQQFVGTSGGAAGTLTSLTPGGGLVSSVTAACSQSAITTNGTFSAAMCVNAQTGTSYTVLDGDRHKLVTFSNASAIAVTLPQAGASSAFVSGWVAFFRNVNVGLVTITPTTSTIDGSATYTLRRGDWVAIVSDGTNYQTFSSRQCCGRLAQVYSASTTYTPGPGQYFVRVEVWGGGGGSGGTNSGTNASAGGGGGEYCETVVAVAPGSGATVTIGAAGTAGTAAGPTGGGTGGQSAFGTITANGGTGSAANSAGAGTSGGAGGSGGTCTSGFNVVGSSGGQNNTVNQGAVLQAGVGGSAFGTPTVVANAAGQAPGDGAAGQVTSSQDGFAGGAGRVKVYE